MRRWVTGQRVPQDAHLRSLKRRALWALTEAGYKPPRLRWLFVDRLAWRDDGEEEWEECHGAAYPRHGVWTLTIIPEGTDWNVARTCIHELCHAVLGQIEREYTFVGDDKDRHDEVFVAMRRLVKRHYRSSRGPPVI
jgi:hypothetical protein